MIVTEPTEQLDDIGNIKKYKTAGLIGTKTVNKILEHAKVGSKLIDLWKIGNDYVNSECKLVYNDITHKGFSFPLCLSVNEVACYYIPLLTCPDILKDGDLLKIELSVHIDGFCSPLCYTTLVCNNKVNDKKKENLLKAVTDTSIQIMKMMKPNNTNIEIADILETNAKKYGCYLPTCNVEGKIAGEFSNQISRYVFDDNNDDDDEFIHNFILTKSNPKFGFTMEESIFEENEVYAIDILMCSGPSKLVEYGKCDIYKRTNNVKLLKLNSSKDALNKFKKEPFPLSLANCETKIKLGIKECIEKELVNTYPVVKCNNGDYVCRVMFTVIIKDEPIIVSGKSANGEFDKFI
jgi:methionine aminopeptidase